MCVCVVGMGGRGQLQGKGYLEDHPHSHTSLPPPFYPPCSYTVVRLLIKNTLL